MNTMLNMKYFFDSEYFWIGELKEAFWCVHSTMTLLAETIVKQKTVHPQFFKKLAQKDTTKGF